MKKNLKKIMQALVLVFACNFINAQQTSLGWAKQFAGSSNNEGRSVFLDASGNIYSCGKLQSTADFNPGAGVFNLTSSGSDDIFISKLDASGNFAWAKKIGDVGNDIATCLTIDLAGNIYITGAFQGTVDFDPGIGIFNLSATMFDGFVLKLDPAGNFIWARQIGGVNNEEETSIATDISGNLYTTGYFNATVDFDPGVGIYNLTASFATDAFISKLDSSGNFIWAKQLSGSNNKYGQSIVISNNGDITLLGYFMGTADFDPGVGTLNLTSAGSFDVFISRLDTAGNFIWAKTMGGTNVEYGYDITLDENGSIYTCGYFQGTSDFDPGAGVFNLTTTGVAPESFISKLDASGNFVWAKQLSSTNGSVGTCLTTDKSKHVYIGGLFNGTADFDPGASSFNLTSTLIDAFICKLDSTGSFIWAKQFQDPGASACVTIDVDNYGDVFTSGHFSGTTDFDPEAGIFNLTTSGGSNTFIHKLIQHIPRLQTTYCGITQTVLNQQLFSEVISGATNYRYEVTNMNTSVTSVITRGDHFNDFYMTWISGVGYGVTYSIRVAAFVGGVWTDYGPACTVTTPTPPTTNLSATYCAISQSTLNQQMFCDAVPGATNYRYEVTNTNNSNVVVYTRGDASTNFYMTWISGVGYGITYSIRVAAAAGGSWTAYGPACTVTTPTPPTTKLATAYCGITQSSLTQQLFCDAVPGATNYRYEVTNTSNSNVVVYTRGDASTNFYMSWISGVGYGTTYSIRVAAAAGSTWTAYGTACTVTTPTPPTTNLSATYCGITQTTLSQQLYCDAVPGATDYKYEITNMSSSSVVFYTRGAGVNNFYMSWVPGVSYGVSYSIRVIAAVGGTWTAYGSACQVTTPASARPVNEETGEEMLTGIEKEMNLSSSGSLVRAYPNPGNGVLNIELGKICREISLSISNEMGQEIRVEKFEGLDLILLDLGEQKGVYFINIRSEKEVFKPLKVVRL